MSHTFFHQAADIFFVLETKTTKKHQLRVLPIWPRDPVLNFVTCVIQQHSQYHNMYQYCCVTALHLVCSHELCSSIRQYQVKLHILIQHHRESFIPVVVLACLIFLEFVFHGEGMLRTRYM